MVEYFNKAGRETHGFQYIVSLIMIESNNFKCIYSGCKITNENNSTAHIFPNAIGGKLKSKNILTIKSNEGNIKKIEDEFIDLFKELLSMIDPVRDRGVTPRHQYTSNLNEKYIQSHGGVFLEHVRFKTTVADNYKNHCIVFGEKPKIKRKQSFDFKKIIPALYVFSVMFAACRGQKIYETFKLFVDNPNLIPVNAGIRLCGVSEKIPRNDKSICHTAIIGCDKNKKVTYVYIEVFEIIAALTYLPYTDDFELYGYSVDITKGSDCEIVVNNDFFDELRFFKIDGYSDEVIYPSMVNLLLKIRGRQFDKFVAELFKEVFSKSAWGYEMDLKLQNAYDLIAKKHKELEEPFIISNRTGNTP